MPVRQQNTPMLPVKNTRLVDAALRTTENLLETNRANVRNAIEATGFPVTVYNRLTQGRRCTCSHQRQELLDVAGNLSTGMIETLVTGLSNGIEDYDSAHPYSSTQDEGKLITIDSHYPNNRTDIRDTTINLVGGAGDPADDDFADVTDMMNLDDVDNEPNRLFIGGSTSCAVCFGSTFVGGYEPLFGARYICDPTHDHVMYNSSLDIEAAPNVFNVYDEGTCTFEVVFPAGAYFGLLPAVFDNKKTLSTSKYVLEVSLDGLAWVVVSPQTVLSTCNGLSSWVRISPAAGGSLRFTHIEFLFSLRASSAPFKADFPEINKGVSLTLADSLASSNIIMPGDIILNRWSVVIDHLPGLSRHWMINTIQPRRDQFGNVYDLSADSRVMDLNELGQLLRPLSSDKNPLV